ncbi:TetR/AcrR family transcriptional regulator [Paractinoplanes atraurantiacus]|uniref:Tetracyclin repressor, C-terminal all-alpha domain n=1 Tax=Paractinoplanes atraurantiacus TaxID=1036182 RepID=A0A285K4A9_9ACTN|nr:TetR family transcriptional regulator [Actinoplanes atraurantiacus]SNY67103.1 Tetracyclin repressor, C-terminal all-alpha domain [Actinoplanes atraurantiacus]
MATRTRNTDDALSAERIVGTAIEMLDEAGEGGLTFRALAARLRTGAGAIYWHVANKDELLSAATAQVLAGAIAAEVAEHAPEEAIRALARGVFDAIDEHPWAGTQLSRVPVQPVMLRIFERLGRQIQALGVPAADQFTWASALLNYILGVAGQNAALARAVAPGTNRPEFLGAIASEWAGLDAAEFPFIRSVAGQLPAHDDRDQFLAGIDLILAGIAAARGQ